MPTDDHAERDGTTAPAASTYSPRTNNPGTNSPGTNSPGTNCPSTNSPTASPTSPRLPLQEQP